MANGLQAVIDEAWETREQLGFDTQGEVRDAVDAAQPATAAARLPLPKP